MFCGKKKEKLTLGTKVPSDDVVQLSVHLGNFRLGLNRNFGLQVKSKQNLEEFSNKKLLNGKIEDIERIKNEIQMINKDVEICKKEKENVEKKFLIKQLKYEKLKSKLLLVLKEYETITDRMAKEFNSK